MLDLQMTLALQRSRRIITDLFQEENPYSKTLKTAGEAKLEPLWSQNFWQFPKIKRAKVPTRASIR